MAKSAPDGYTFLAPAAGVLTNAMIKTRLPYKEEDLVPVALLAVSPSVIVVPADSPVKDLKEPGCERQRRKEPEFRHGRHR
ncbi:hypothetical protein LMG32289_06424 [Cupriavidus pampae]|uniref:Uncharacterized protein n=1 Tax=Cupriavidus pampae TaxID=659251 RepID=A0ABN7ZKG4_9BURK|nr:hypothetical protein LMG32289_06424 [Cupriavidus pampae]